MANSPWADVRRELTRIVWLDTDQAVTGRHWAAVADALTSVRSTLGPILPTDPFATVRTAVRGVGDQSDDAGPLEPLRSAVRAVTRHEQAAAMTVDDVTRIALEITHWSRMHAESPTDRAWLHAAERALDAALHGPAVEASAQVILAAWERTLVETQQQIASPAVERCLLSAHAGLARNTHDLLEQALAARVIDPDVGRELRDAVRATAAATGDRRRELQRILPGSASERAVMGKLSTIANDLREARASDTPGQHLDALLRSTVGRADLVMTIAGADSARRPAANLSRLSLEYGTSPWPLLITTRWPAVAAVAEPPVVAPVEQTAPVPEVHRVVVEGSVTPGVRLEYDELVVLCRARDVGVAAALGDPTHPLLAGVDRATWPDLIVEGQQAVADMVTSVLPLAHRQASLAPTFQREDVLAESFEVLLRVAQTFTPIEGGTWSGYAGQAMNRVRWRGVDTAGVPHRRHATDDPTMLTLELAPQSAAASAAAEDVVMADHDRQQLREAIGQLPTPLRDALVRAMTGARTNDIAAELGLDASAVSRRLAQARQHVAEGLAADGRTARPGTAFGRLLEQHRNQSNPAPTQADQPPPRRPDGPQRTL
mgnify:CR=1 FL=1